MPLVQVWNDNVHPLTEKFRGMSIQIPPGAYIVMDSDDAHSYLGQYMAPTKTKDGGMDPRGFKMLRVMPHTGASTKETKEQPTFICDVCRYSAPNQTDLDEHNELNHLDQLQDPELAAEIKRKRGRPAKVAVKPEDHVGPRD